jgi:hypothetical protein
MSREIENENSEIKREIENDKEIGRDNVTQKEQQTEELKLMIVKDEEKSQWQ